MSKKLVWTDEKIIEHIEEEGYKFIKFIDEKDGKIYNKKGLKRRIEIWCGNPNHKSYDVEFANFKNKKRCPYCNGKIKFTYEYVKEYIESFGYTLLSDKYEGCNEKIKFMCDEGHIYETSFNSFKNNSARCNICANKMRGQYNKFTYEYVKNYIESFGYKLLSDKYENCDEYLNIQCDKGHKYKVTFYCFKNECQRCPYCNESRGEIKIREILQQYNIKFEFQKKYENLYGIGGRLLSYDFYLSTYNLLIEYQGEYHDGNNRIQKEEKLKTQQEHDKRKREYAKNNNIQLLEIWYWDFNNIEEILKKELNL